MKYTVSVAIDGRIDVNVEADSFEDAKSKISLIDIDLSTPDPLVRSQILYPAELLAHIL